MVTETTHIEFKLILTEEQRKDLEEEYAFLKGYLKEIEEKLDY